MLVNATEFKNRVGKYLEIVENEEVIILKNGKKIAKLIPFETKDTPNVDGLLGLLKKANKETQEIDLDTIKDERLKKHEGIT